MLTLPTPILSKLIMKVLNSSVFSKMPRLRSQLVLLSLLILVAPPAAIRAQLPGRSPFRIVHLGDSYSSGNGARNENGDKTFYSVSGCYRSQSNWGSHFAESLTDVFAVTYINRACSGGVLAETSPRSACWTVSPVS